MNTVYKFWQCQLKVDHLTNITERPDIRVISTLDDGYLLVSDCDGNSATIAGESSPDYTGDHFEIPNYEGYVFVARSHDEVDMIQVECLIQAMGLSKISQQ